jgi:hypothetical protein
VLTTAGPWPAGNAGRGVVGAPGSSRSLPIPPAPPKPTLHHRDDHRPAVAPPEGPAGSGRVAGLTLGGRLRTMRASLSRTQPLPHTQPSPRVTHQPPGALEEQSGSERWPDAAAARPGRVGPARLEDVQKVLRGWPKSVWHGSVAGGK